MTIEAQYRVVRSKVRLDMRMAEDRLPLPLTFGERLALLNIFASLMRHDAVRVTRNPIRVEEL
jgi:hypothetical protein